MIAAVYVDSGTIPLLTGSGVRDSKSLSDGRVTQLGSEIRARCIHSTVTIGPQRYNELYAEIRNLNRLLAWGHARALENVLDKLAREGIACGRAVTDQFGDQRLVLNALLEKGKNIHLEQRPRAEADLGVAAASILARSEFLRQLRSLSKMVDAELPKGASAGVENAARNLVQKHGPDVLQKVAKLHFKTTKRVLDV